PMLQFGVFEIDLRSGELRRAGIRVKIQEQPFKVLVALLEQPGEVVSREELRQRIWPDATFGDGDHAVNVAVTKLRAALGDSAAIPRVIETLPRRGYRLIVAATRVESDAFSEQVAKATLAHPATISAASALETTSTSQALSSASGLPVARWIVFTVAVAIAVGSAMWLHKPRAATSANTTILIGPFENNTGEAVLDGTLQFALERELSNSQLLDVVSPERVQDILQ